MDSLEELISLYIERVIRGTQVLTWSDIGFVLEHAREMMRVIATEHICRFADASAAHEDIFCSPEPPTNGSNPSMMNNITK